MYIPSKTMMIQTPLSAKITITRHYYTIWRYKLSTKLWNMKCRLKKKNYIIGFLIGTTVNFAKNLDLVQ